SPASARPMTFARRLIFILAACLAIHVSAMPPVRAQQDEAAALIGRVSELYKAKKYAEAIPFAQRALAIHEQTLGSNHVEVANSLGWLAVLYREQGRYADAEPLLRRSLAIKEKVLGPDHPDVATSLDDLALLYANQSRYIDAEALYRRALAIRE